MLDLSVGISFEIELFDWLMLLIGKVFLFEWLSFGLKRCFSLLRSFSNFNGRRWDLLFDFSCVGGRFGVGVSCPAVHLPLPFCLFVSLLIIEIYQHFYFLIFHEK